MITTIEKMQKKSLSRPDETRLFEKGKVELVTAGDVTFGRVNLQPGWRCQPVANRPLQPRVVKGLASDLSHFWPAAHQDG